MTYKKQIILSFMCFLLLIAGIVAFSACDSIFKKYTLSFVVDGANYTTIKTGGRETVTIPEDPIKEGYEFNGWYLDENVWKQPFYADYLSFNPISGDQSVYAKFDVISYDIRYEADSGTHSNPIKYTIEDNIDLSEAEKPGYSFIGWYNNDSYTTEVTAINAGSVGAITLYAKFEVIAYDIIYEDTKGADNNNAKTYTIESNTISLSDIAINGYTFNGWYDGQTKVTEISAGSTGNITLTAKWTPISYNIIYEGTKGAKNTNVKSYSIESNTISLSDIAINGYIFNGWYDGQTKVTEISAGSTGNITLTAKWTPISYAIFYENVKGAENSNANEYNIENETITLVDLEKTGYIFDGWFKGENRITRINKGTTGDLTLTAKWIAISYEIKYHNVAGATNNNPKSYDIETQSLTFVDATRDNYIFAGWFYDAACENEVIEIKAGTIGELNLYAKWDTNIHYIDSNGTIKYYTNNDITELSSSGDRTLTGWYFLTGSVSGRFTMTVSGEAHIIIADKCNWTLYGDLIVPKGNKVNVYGQSWGDNAGTLQIDGNFGGSNGADGNDSRYGSGGNGSNGADCGTIIINGSTIIASNIGGGIGGRGGKGYLNVSGDGYYGNGGDGGTGGAGGDGGTIIINGGMITATTIGGGTGGIGGEGDIGYRGAGKTPGGVRGDGGTGGVGGAGGTIIINGGMVTATNIGGGTGGNGGDGGGGYSNYWAGGSTLGGVGGTGGKGGESGAITLNNGTVKVTNIGGGAGGTGGEGGTGGYSSGTGGQGGVGGAGGNCSTISIKGGTISAANICGGIGGKGGEGGTGGSGNVKVGGTGGKGGDGGSGGVGGSLMISRDSSASAKTVSSGGVGGKGGSGRNSSKGSNGYSGASGSNPEIFYSGTVEDWNNEEIYLLLSEAEVYFYSETEPTEVGQYWHYDTDGVTLLIW